MRPGPHDTPSASLSRVEHCNLFGVRALVARCFATMSSSSSAPPATAAVLLKKLLRWSPKNVPLSHVKYGPDKEDLKSQLERIRNNWCPADGVTVATAPPALRLTPVQKKEFTTALPWITPYVQALREKRSKRRSGNTSAAAASSAASCRAWRKRKLVAAAVSSARSGSKSSTKSTLSSYSTANFTEDHEEFKELTSAAFARAVKAKVSKSRWVVLDDFSKKSKQRLRTLSVMKSVGLDVNRRAFLCNPGERQVMVALRSGMQGVARMKCEDAMQTVCRRMKFGAAYLDLCAGSARYVSAVLSAVMEKSTKQFVVGVTITGRDRTGECMSARLKRLTTMLEKQHGMKPLAVSEQGEERHVLRYRGGSSVVTMYFCRDK